MPAHRPPSGARISGTSWEALRLGKGFVTEYFCSRNGLRLTSSSGRFSTYSPDMRKGPDRSGPPHHSIASSSSLGGPRARAAMPARAKQMDEPAMIRTWGSIIIRGLSTSKTFWSWCAEKAKATPLRPIAGSL